MTGIASAVYSPLSLRGAVRLNFGRYGAAVMHAASSSRFSEFVYK